MQLLDEGGPPSFQSLDHQELPEGTSPIEGIGDEERHEVEELPHGARCRNGEASNVMVDVELGVVDPHRRRQVRWCRLDSLTQSRDGHRGAFHASS